MSNKENLLNANKKRALPPKTRNIPEATELPLSEDGLQEASVGTRVNESLTENNNTNDSLIKEETVKTTKRDITPIEPPVTEQTKRGPGKPKKRKDGDKKISFWLDEELVPGLFSGLGYGDSAGSVINEAIREYQKNHNLL